MLVLVETAAGYGLFKVSNKKLLDNPDKLAEAFADGPTVNKSVKLHAWHSFKDSKHALDAATHLIEGTMGKPLSKFLRKNVVEAGLTDELALQDRTLAAAIQKDLSIPCVVNATSLQLWRGIREQLSSLVEGIAESELKTMSMGLSHTINRFKLKFSPEKVDTMIIQAVGLLDDLDKELNNFAMRLREWYGWHFPELAKIVTDNYSFAKVVKGLGFRTNAKSLDWSHVLPDEDLTAEVKTAAEISMGVEITEEDLAHITELADRVIELSEYRRSLADYLQQRMVAISPNLTHMVGELVGARLISHAGSLMNLAKHPASTVQILGAEKALFRALKTKQSTPKYGLIYHASVVGQSNPSCKGKISRVLAAKLSLCARVDALGEQSEVTVGRMHKEYVERKLKAFENGDSNKISRAGASFPRPGGFQKPSNFAGGYNNAGDAVKRVNPVGGPDAKKARY